MRSRAKALIVLTLIVVSACTQTRHQRALEGQAIVVDGDSFWLGNDRIRLAGIDAPELSQPCYRSDGKPWPCGRESAHALGAFIGHDTVSCVRAGRDRYDRILAHCTVRGVDVGANQVNTGNAIAYLRYSDRYEQAETSARAAGQGIWAGKFESPEVYRQQ